MHHDKQNKKFTSSFQVQVLPNLYIGSIGAGYNLEQLQEHHITHILVASSTIGKKFEDLNLFEYMHVDIADINAARICEHFEASNTFIAR